MNAAQERKTLAEYAEADVIYIHSEHVWRTFVENGVPESKLRPYHLRSRTPVSARLKSGERRAIQHCLRREPERLERDPGLDGSVPQIGHPNAPLTLVGGCGSRGMRRHVEAALRSRGSA